MHEANVLVSNYIARSNSFIANWSILDVAVPLFPIHENRFKLYVMQHNQSHQHQAMQFHNHRGCCWGKWLVVVSVVSVQLYFSASALGSHWILFCGRNLDFLLVLVTSWIYRKLFLLGNGCDYGWDFASHLQVQYGFLFGFAILWRFF